ncbi:MAG: hypothetical protein P8O10_14725 [Pseudorhodobacter sp.]|nr:hypothetical protein [Pseudorhodobacter sp.]
MSFGEIFKDTATPQFFKDVENLKKVGDALKKAKTKPQEEVVDELHSIVKKGWLERAEKQLIKIGKGYDKVYRAKYSMPRDNTENFEKVVIKTYKAERAKGIPHEKCKQTKAAIEKMVDYLQAYEKEARAKLEEVGKITPAVRKYAKEFTAKREAAKYLEKQFRELAQVVLISPFNAEMVTYMLHCGEIAKQCTICAGTLKKMDKKFSDMNKEFTEIAEITHDQVFYVWGGDLFDDLPNRI